MLHRVRFLLILQDGRCTHVTRRGETIEIIEQELEESPGLCELRRVSCATEQTSHDGLGGVRCHHKRSRVESRYLESHGDKVPDVLRAQTSKESAVSAPCFPWIGSRGALAAAVVEVLRYP